MNLYSVREKMMTRKAGVIGDRKEFAVLIPLVEREGKAHFLFEKRAAGIRQPGDVCFPGGKMEKGESPAFCAVRETFEETGIRNIDVLGRFDSILEVNRITMHTVVGILNDRELERAVLNPAEVEEIFTVPCEFFLEAEPMIYTGKIIQDVTDFPYEEAGIRKDYNWRVGQQDIYIYHYEGRVIWGLTAMIAKHFAECMK